MYKLSKYTWVTATGILIVGFMILHFGGVD
jgi:hypothetical protein